MRPASESIVVTLDGSRNAELAVPPALELAKAWSSRLRFVHIVEGEGTELARPWTEVPLEKFEEYVRGLVGAAAGEGVDWEAALAFGQAAKQIVQLSEGARAVVMATHGLGGFHATFLGSVTDKVVRSARSPVLTVPIEGKQGLKDGPVVIPLDGSEAAAKALAIGRELAGAFGQRVVLVRAYTPPLGIAPDFPAVDTTSFAVVKQAAEEYLSSIALPGENTIVGMGRAASVIQDTAESVSAGLIVISARGSGLAARVLGSTTDRVVHTVRRPILILPASD